MINGQVYSLTTHKTCYYSIDVLETVLNNFTIVYNTMFYGHYTLGYFSFYPNCFYYQGEENQPFMYLNKQAFKSLSIRLLI